MHAPLLFLPGLEGEVSEHLQDAGVAAVELIEASEQWIAGNQVVAGAGEPTRGDVVDEAAGVLRVVEDVISLGAEIDGKPLGEVETLLDRDVDVIDRVQREGVAAAVGHRARTRDNIAGVGVVGHISDDGTAGGGY